MRARTVRSSSRYGSRASPHLRAQFRRGRFERQLVAQRVELLADRDPRRPIATAGTPRASPRGVTCGLPSRSPPIQEPKRIGAASMGRPRPVLARRARSTPRTKRGSASQRLCSNTMRPLRTSSSGVGRCSRTSLVCQAAAISRRSASIRSVTLGHGQVGTVACRQRRGNAVVLLDERPARHFGRMRGQHQLDPQRADRLVQPLRRDAAREQPREGVLARPALRRRQRIALIRAAPADAVMLLGDVGQVEEVRERARDRAARRRAAGATSSSARTRKSASWPARPLLASARTRSTVLKSRSPACALSVSPSSSPSNRTSSRSGLCGSDDHFSTIPHARRVPKGRVWGYDAAMQRCRAWVLGLVICSHSSRRCRAHSGSLIPTGMFREHLTGK